ncbi:CPBP family intramembrane metalloprotease [Candidatus Gracilibacteria bacterium]|nr:CPBP family intramembrane metalloprotease [Candidatus Gracilibacteria bacterium]
MNYFKLHVVTQVCLAAMILAIGSVMILPEHFWELPIIILYLFQELLFFLPLYVFVLRKYKPTWRDLGWVPVRFKPFLKTLGLALGIFIAIELILSFIGSNWPNLPGFSPQEEFLSTAKGRLLDQIILFVIAIGIAPFLEELFFRGFMLKTLMGHMTFMRASLISGLFFTIVHFQFESFFLIFPLALLLNWIYRRHNSIIPGIFFHIVNNALALIIELVITKS